MKIRKATVQDVPKLIELTMKLRKLENSLSDRIACGEKTKNFFEMVFEKYLDDKAHVFLVAEEREVVGFAYGWKENIYPVYKNEFVGYIADVLVEEKERGKGIGKTLVTALEKEFKKMGLNETKLIVLKDNIKAYDLWKEMGYADLYVEMRKDL